MDNITKKIIKVIVKKHLNYIQRGLIDIQDTISSDCGIMEIWSDSMITEDLVEIITEVYYEHENDIHDQIETKYFNL